MMKRACKGQELPDAIFRWTKEKRLPHVFQTFSQFRSCFLSVSSEQILNDHISCIIPYSHEYTNINSPKCPTGFTLDYGYSRAVIGAYNENKVRSQRKVCWHAAFDWVAFIKNIYIYIPAACTCFLQSPEALACQRSADLAGSTSSFSNLRDDGEPSMLKHCSQSVWPWSLFLSQGSSEKCLAVTYNKPHRIASCPCETSNNRHLSSTCVQRAFTFIPYVQKGVISI